MARRPPAGSCPPPSAEIYLTLVAYEPPAPCVTLAALQPALQTAPRRRARIAFGAVPVVALGPRGYSQGKACTRPLASALSSYSLRILFVFSSYSLRILFVFRSCFVRVSFVFFPPRFW